MRGGLAKMHSFKNTAKRMFKSAWFVIAAGMWIQCTTAQSYVFSIYSESIKENLGYNQQELDSVSFWKDIGGNVGVISGLLYEIFSPWIILAIAAAMAFSGNLMTWLSITAKVQTPTLWLMCLYALVGSNAQTFSNTAVIVTCVKIFPRSRGTIVGLMKGCFGLSGAVLVQLYYAAYGTEQQEFPLLLAWLLPTVCLMFMFVIRPLRAVESGNQKKWLDRFSAVLLVLAAYLLGTIIFQSCLSLERSWNIAIFGGVVAILICPIWVLLQSELYVCGSYSSENDALLPKTYENESCLEQKCGELETPQEEAIRQDIRSHSPPGAVAGSNSVKLTSSQVQVFVWLEHYSLVSYFSEPGLSTETCG